jgi:DNA-directed RNA polymerase subunit RPC12/RpoP
MNALETPYVCDSCGHIDVREQVPEGGEWTCSECGSHRAWEFPPERWAEACEHAAHIARGVSSRGLFRRTRAS